MQEYDLLSEAFGITFQFLNHAEKSFRHFDFLVVQDIFLTETAQMADVVLPACCFAEKEGTFSNTERRVQRVRKAVNPPGQARQDWQILADIATRMGYPNAAMWHDNESDYLMQQAMTRGFRELADKAQREGIAEGRPCTLLFRVDPVKPWFECDMAIPVKPGSRVSR